MKRWLIMVMVLILSTSLLLAACSNSKEEASDSQASGNTGTDNVKTEEKPKTETPASEPKKEEKEEPIEISWLSFNFPEKDDSVIQKWMEEKFNVKIKNIRIDRSSWDDQLNVKLASGELPDVWLLWGTNNIITYSKQGLLGELPVDEIKKNMPTLQKFIDENQPGAWNDGLINGKSYGIPITNLDGALPLNPVYNADWLKKVGYNEPPKTIQELEDVLYKFRNNDPDGNGKKDTYGLTAMGKGNLGQAAQSLGYVFGAFHTLPGYWSEDANGNLVYDMTTENARQAFKLLNKWFNDGVLDPEFITNDGKPKDYKDLVAGRTGVSTIIWTHYIPSADFGQDAAKNGINFTVGKALDGPYGTGKLQAWGLTGNYIGMSVDAAKDPKKKAKIYEILNSLYSDVDSYLTTQYGVEGTHYDMVDGKPVRKPDFTDSKVRQNLGMGYWFGLMSLKSKEFEKFTYSAEDLALREQTTAGIDRMFNQVKFAIPALAQYPDLKNLEVEHFIKFITGEVDLDAGFDKFVETWKKSGGDEITKQANEINKQNKGN